MKKRKLRKNSKELEWFRFWPFGLTEKKIPQSKGNLSSHNNSSAVSQALLMLNRKILLSRLCSIMSRNQTPKYLQRKVIPRHKSILWQNPEWMISFQIMIIIEEMALDWNFKLVSKLSTYKSTCSQKHIPKDMWASTLTLDFPEVPKSSFLKMVSFQSVWDGYKIFLSLFKNFGEEYFKIFSIFWSMKKKALSRIHWSLKK